MTTSQKSIFGLEPFVAPSNFGSDLVPSTPSRALRRDATYVMEESQKQTLVMHATAMKTILAQNAVAGMHMHTAAVFDQTAGYILALKNQPRGQEHQAYVDEFATRQLQSLGRHMLGILEVGCTSIGYEVNRSLYPPPPDFWERMFG